MNSISIIVKFLLAFSCIVFSTKGRAQIPLRTDVLMYNDGLIFVADTISNVIVNNIDEMPIVKGNKIASKLLFGNKTIQLNDHLRTQFKITTIGIDNILIEQLDSSNNLQARGFVVPNWNDSIIEQHIVTINPETGEETIHDYSHQKLYKTGDWQLLKEGSKFEIGKFSNNKKDGLWLLVDTIIPEDLVFEQWEYDNGKLKSHIIFDFSQQAKIVKEKLQGQWILYSMLANTDFLVAHRQFKNSYKLRAIGLLCIFDNNKISLSNNLNCKTVKHNEQLKEMMLKGSTLSFGNYNLEIKYFDEDKIVFKTLKLN